MTYHCLVCDVDVAAAAFPAHAAEHGWDMDAVRQVGYEQGTHEFGEPCGPSLFWLIRRPVEVAHGC